ncbi:uncharacterized protein LOC119103308 [Pollicipes pollicipes]|uniref:uncharacterized protein LOC119103308 n=1 Tax=Pollicipes pollicipes TaxID=41117 RepID=UPI0018855E39|nr:uncharacterized protein LOC119103308 [Pollicipes pollicipes]
MDSRKIRGICHARVNWDDASQGQWHYVSLGKLSGPEPIEAGSRVSMKYGGGRWTGTVAGKQPSLEPHDLVEDVSDDDLPIASRWHKEHPAGSRRCEMEHAYPALIGSDDFAVVDETSVIGQVTPAKTQGGEFVVRGGERPAKFMEGCSFGAGCSEAARLLSSPPYPSEAQGLIPTQTQGTASGVSEQALTPSSTSVRSTDTQGAEPAVPYIIAALPANTSAKRPPSSPPDHHKQKHSRATLADDLRVTDADQPEHVVGLHDSSVAFLVTSTPNGTPQRCSPPVVCESDTLSGLQLTDMAAAATSESLSALGDIIRLLDSDGPLPDEVLRDGRESDHDDHTALSAADKQPEQHAEHEQAQPALTSDRECW